MIKDNKEKLVNLSKLSNRVKVKPMYFLQNIPGSINGCYAREEAAKKLVMASEQLPAEHFLVIFDAWRPKEVQQFLYNQFKEKLLAEGAGHKALYTMLSLYVDKPSEIPDKPFNHLTGGAIDLTIGNKDGLLNMGTDFDDFSKKAHMDAYENLPAICSEDKKIRNNRRLLKKVMENAGFINYAEEWWHFDYGNQNWAKSIGRTAFYGGIHRLKDHLIN